MMAEEKMQSWSIIIIGYNEEGNIAEVIESAMHVLNLISGAER
jgi:hypothetical protein